MKAFLLAAGLGTRLRPLTDETPKCLLPIGGKPLLQIWLENLERDGINEVLVNTHWHHEKVNAFLEGRQSSKPKVISFYEPELLGSAGTLKANHQWVDDDEPFYILYGDNYTYANLAPIALFHREHGLPFTLGVFKAENPTQCGIVEIAENGLVMSFVEKPKEPKSSMAAAGIYVADRRIFDFFPASEAMPSAPLDLGYHVIPRLVGKMNAFFIQELLMDIGTPESYEEALRLRASKQNGAHIKY
jgi:mannose-1-phosphate guanylyltransferase